eukprot:scaffold60600_cov68-Phaeocystis_antarctica.AAC.2
MLTTDKFRDLLLELPQFCGGYFFAAGVTPPELLKLGIYAEIAIPMKAGEYRSVSRGLLDHALRVEQNGSAAPCLAALCHLPPWAQRRLRLLNREAWCTHPRGGASPPPPAISSSRLETTNARVVIGVCIDTCFSALSGTQGRVTEANPTRTRLSYHCLTCGEPTVANPNKYTCALLQKDTRRYRADVCFNTIKLTDVKHAHLRLSCERQGGASHQNQSRPPSVVYLAVSPLCLLGLLNAWSGRETKALASSRALAPSSEWSRGHRKGWVPCWCPAGALQSC